MTVTVH